MQERRPTALQDRIYKGDSEMHLISGSGVWDSGSALLNNFQLSANRPQTLYLTLH